MNTENINLIMIIISVLSGVLVGGGGVFAVLSKANQSIQLKDSTEQLLANLIPAEAVTMINGLAHRALDLVPSAKEAVEFVESVTDGEDNAPNAVG